MQIHDFSLIILYARQLLGHINYNARDSTFNKDLNWIQSCFSRTRSGLSVSIPLTVNDMPLMR